MQRCRQASRRRVSRGAFLEGVQRAKVALDGKIISEPPVPQTNCAPENYMLGTWSVSIGDWKGYFTFQAHRTVTWRERKTPDERIQASGTRSGSVDWSFSDDAPGWKRTFEVLTPPEHKPEREHHLNGRPHGFFTMSKQPY
jgi:hypothetical protein